MKIALCRPGNLPRLIDLVYGQELAVHRAPLCTSSQHGASVERATHRGHPSQDWSRLMRTLAQDAEIALWKARIEWLQSAT